MSPPNNEEGSPEPKHAKLRAWAKRALPIGSFVLSAAKLLWDVLNR